MRTLGLVLVMLFAFAGAGVADIATIDLYAAPGWNLISAPRVPFNPDPYAVFDGFTIDYALQRTDPTTGSPLTFGIDDFGNILLGDGYWFQNYGTKTAVTYDAVADGVPDSNNVMTDMWISLPGLKETPTNLDKGGWHCIGAPFDHDTPIEKIWFTDGITLKSWVDASTPPGAWVDFQMWYDEYGYQSFANDGGGNDDQMRHGKGYFFQTGKDDLAMIIEAE